MFLFGKNKIIKYINEHPESKVSLMLLLKSCDSGKLTYLYDFELDNYQIANGNGSRNFSNDYNVLIEINRFAKAELITWVGSNIELEEKRRKEAEEMERYFREVLGKTLESKTVTFIVKENSLKKPKSDIILPAYSSALEDKIASFNLEMKMSDLKFFTNLDEYEHGLERAIELFGARPNSKEFDDLLILLFKIDHYERNNLAFPEVSVIQFILHMMNFFKLEIQNFKDILSENDFKLFLAGELKLKAYTLNRVLTRLGIKFLKKTKKN